MVFILDFFLVYFVSLDLLLLYVHINKHKFVLRDAFIYGNNPTAKDVFKKLADWSVNVVAKVSDADMESMLNTEHGGMNESMLDAYPNLRHMYDENDGNTQVFYMKNAVATFSAFGKASEVEEF